MTNIAATNTAAPIRKDQAPNPIDVHVGTRLRQRRTLLGVSQEKLGEALGVTFQQVQKYERGTNRIGASRLFEISLILDLPVSYFFDGLPPETGGRAVGLAEEPSPFELDLMTRRETLELVRFYYTIDDPQIRRRILDLTRTLAGVDAASSSARPEKTGADGDVPD